jgi:hypothetical protein
MKNGEKQFSFSWNADCTRLGAIGLASVCLQRFAEAGEAVISDQSTDL